jgi:5'-deoxynucleotidase YfbR-like HD superfamily hydrolase
MAKERIGDWFETYTGKRFWHLDPRAEDICIEDIGHGLSNMCRFNGQSKHFYSVAQHSINCAELAERKGYGRRLQLLSLLHDAAEAYVGDIVKPLKPYLIGFKEIENRIQEVIYEALNIVPPTYTESKIVKKIDTVMLVTEARVLTSMNGWGKWTEDVEADEHTVITLEPIPDVENWFLFMAKGLGAKA